MSNAIPSAKVPDLLRMKEALRGSLQYIDEAFGRSPDGRLMAPEFEPTWMTHGHYHAAIRDIERGKAASAIDHLNKAAASVRNARAAPDVRYFLPERDAELMLLLRGELALHQDRAIGVGYTSEDVRSTTVERDKAMEGIGLLRSFAPGFYAEFSELSDMILLAGEDDGVHIRSASSFNLFGLIVIWADAIHSPIYYLQQIVHETAHLRLFVVNIEDPLVLNPPEQKFRAPFRDDERPMLGIFHAYFVLARMVLGMREVQRNLPANSQHHDDLRQKLAVSEKRFFNTAKEVEQHGILTSTAQSIYTDCMSAVEANHATSDSLLAV